jgi:hypothetical protein
MWPASQERVMRHFLAKPPEANFVMVKTDFMDAHIADAIRYIFCIASELNRPAVVNLSLGGHADAHDGTDSLSQIIDGEWELAFKSRSYGSHVTPATTRRSARFLTSSEPKDGIPL